MAAHAHSAAGGRGRDVTTPPPLAEGRRPRTDGAEGQGTEDRDGAQAMPGEAARAELPLPEADGTEPHTGEAASPHRWAPHCPLP